jgi:alpha-L-rhamnosidase
MTALTGLAGVEVTALRCEKLRDPLGIDVHQPRLSWVLSATDRAVQQRAYQVLVATSLERLKAGRGDLWDSGRVAADQSTFVPYGGKPLRAEAECFWKVRVWDTEQHSTDWSPPARWTMGLLEPADWRAQWIGQEAGQETNHLAGTSWIWFPAGAPEQAAPVGTNYFRRVVTLPAGREIKRASFCYTGDNEARGWINLQDIGARNNFRAVKDNDITGRIEPGKTYVFGLTGRNLGTNENPAGVVGLIQIEFKSGAPLLIPTDASWKVCGRELPGWNTPEFDDSAWVAAKALGPVGMAPWGEVRVSESRRQPARWLRKEFAVEKKVRRATVSYAGLGLSELYVNGAKIGDAVLSPALAQYDKRVYYVTHEITRQLQRGNNALGVVLGGGRYYADRSKVYAGTVSFGWPKLRLQLRIEYTDGSVGEVVSDESWKLTLDGPILANSEFDGEDYDARKELRGWSQVKFDDSTWQPVQLVSAPPGELAAQMTEPIRVTQTIQPVGFSEVKPGVFIYDLGQNLVGWCRLRVKGPAGRTVTLRHAETLNPDVTLYTANLRSAQVTDRYTLKGKGREVWEPRFTYHGFRYVEVTGLPGIASLAAIEGRVVHDDLPRAGAFECSNELLNQIYRNVFWGTRGNYRSIPTDCPQRDERQGWLGDRSEECRGETYLFDISKLYPKWLQDISDAQRASGSVPDVAPAFWPIYSDNVTWPSTLITAPGVVHRQFGDVQPIAARYESARRWLDFMSGFITNGIIAKDSYGDWCVPPEDPALIHSKDPARQTDRALLATAYFVYDLKLMERYAKLLDKPDDAARFAKRAAELKSAFNHRFLDRAKGQYDNGSQTSCVLPLAFGLVPEELRNVIFRRLVTNIEKETRGHIGTGLIGGQFLCRVLSDHGRADLAYRIATQKDYPGWGYMISQGATTIWELWNGNTADPTMNSGNHVMLVGDLVIWLYEYLAGIAADPEQPGFKHIVMKPHPVGDLKFVKAAHQSPYGRIASEWRKEGRTCEWRIEIPANSTATVYVPKMPRQRVTESGSALGGVRGVKLLRGDGDWIVLQLGSGTYHLFSE